MPGTIAKSDVISATVNMPAMALVRWIDRGSEI